MENDNLESYVPEIIESNKTLYAKMFIQLETCSCCKKPMMKEAPYGVFPNWLKLNQKEQAIKADIQIFHSTIGYDKICKKCVEDGIVTFECHLCNTKKPLNKIQKEIGSPSDYLCSDCYETIPAKMWDEKIEEMEENHKYDFNN